MTGCHSNRTNNTRAYCMIAYLYVAKSSKSSSTRLTVTSPHQNKTNPCVHSTHVVGGAMRKALEQQPTVCGMRIDEMIHSTLPYIETHGKRLFSNQKYFGGWNNGRVVSLASLCKSTPLSGCVFSKYPSRIILICHSSYWMQGLRFA